MPVCWARLVSISPRARLLAISSLGAPGTYWVLPDRLVIRRTSLAPMRAISSGSSWPDSKACVFWSMRRANSAGSGGSAANWTPSSAPPTGPRSLISPRAAFSNTSSQVLNSPKVSSPLMVWSTSFLSLANPSIGALPKPCMYAANPSACDSLRLMVPSLNRLA